MLHSKDHSLTSSKEERREPKKAELTRSVYASTVLQAILGTDPDSDSEAHSAQPIHHCVQTCSLPRPPIIAEDPAPFVSVPTAANDTSSNTAWWDDTPSPDALMMTSTACSFEENRNHDGGSDTPPAYAPTGFDESLESIVKQPFAEHDGRCNYPDTIRFMTPIEHSIVTTPSNRPIPLGSVARRQGSTSPVGGFGTATTSVTCSRLNTPIDKVDTGQFDAITIRDSDDEDDLKARLWRSQGTHIGSILEEAPLLYNKSYKHSEDLSAIQQRSRPSTFPDFTSYEHRFTSRCAGTCAEFDFGSSSRHTTPEIIFTHVDAPHTHWQPIKMSALPLAPLGAPLVTSNAFQDVRPLSRHPWYWNHDLVANANIWLLQIDTVSSAMALSTVSFAADQSLAGRASICNRTHAHKGRNASSIVLVRLRLPEQARNVLNSNADLDWFVLHIVWIESDVSSPFTTTIAFPVSFVTHMASHAGLSRLEATPPAFRFLLNNPGPSPVACGTGMDEWALEEFMAACSRGDGMITMNL